MLKVIKTALKEVLLLEYDIAQDNRAIFHRTFSREELRKINLCSNFTENISYHVSKKNTLYGIHFQNNPRPQTKLIYCTQGRILDYAIDLRHNSPTYKKWICYELDAINRRQLYIPHGFGHAALTLEDNTTIEMKIDNVFDPQLSRAIRYDDEEIALNISIPDLILSEQDRDAPYLRESDCNL